MNTKYQLPPRVESNNQQANTMANKGVGLDCGVLVCDQKVYERN